MFCAGICRERDRGQDNSPLPHHTTLTVCGAMRGVSRKGSPPRVSPNFSSSPIISSMIWSWICRGHTNLNERHKPTGLTFSGVSVAISVGLSGFKARFRVCPRNIPEWLGDPVMIVPGWLGEPPIFNWPPSNVPTGLRCCGDTLWSPLSIGSL